VRGTDLALLQHRSEVSWHRIAPLHPFLSVFLTNLPIHGQHYLLERPLGKLPLCPQGKPNLFINAVRITVSQERHLYMLNTANSACDTCLFRVDSEPLPDDNDSGKCFYDASLKPLYGQECRSAGSEIRASQDHRAQFEATPNLSKSFCLMFDLSRF